MFLPRLKKRADFLRVSRSGISVRTSTVVVQCFARKGQHPFVRVGFTASRRVGNAVGRNRAKRRLRALVDKTLWERIESLSPTGKDWSFDIVFVAVPWTIEVEFPQLREDLVRGVDLCVARLFSGKKSMNEKKRLCHV